MAAKGNSNNCCCGGCAQSPRDGNPDNADRFGLRVLEVLQQFCCSCVPFVLCVTYQCQGTTYRASMRLGCVEGGRFPLYSGTMPIDGVATDISLHFQIVDETCYLVLFSTALGIDGTDSTHMIELTAANRLKFCRDMSLCTPCTSCSEYATADEFADCECLTWLIDIAGCPDTATFRICPASVASLVYEDRLPCPECIACSNNVVWKFTAAGFNPWQKQSESNPACCTPDPPDQTDFMHNIGELVTQSCTNGGVVVSDETPHCGRLCDGCSCICDSACITVVVNDETHANNSITTERAIFVKSDSSYTTASGFKIKIQANETTNECELALTEYGTYTPTLAPDPVNISGTTDSTTCPNPSARWAFVDASDPLIGVTVIFNCAMCRECDQIAEPQCCPEGDGTIPRALTATISTGALCCGDVTVGLVYDPVAVRWEGTSPDVWAADGPYCDRYINLKLSCGAGGTWTLLFSTDSTCIYTDAVVGTGTCTPVNLSFSFTATGPSCCHESTSGMPPVLPTAAVTIVITE